MKFATVLRIRPIRSGVLRWIAAGMGMVLLLATGCTGGGEPSERDHASLMVMYFNTENGGRLAFSSVIEAIDSSRAQVVALGEAVGTTEKVAEALGWPYFDARRAIVSQLPLIPSPGDDPTYAYVELEPGKLAAMANVHLPGYPYGPNLIKKGRTLEEALENEEAVRLPEIERVIQTLAPIVVRGTPTFIPGDFNTPSHRDWTEETAGSRPQIRFAMPWPVTIALEEAGYVDAYRVVYPDPATHPGLTWPAWRPDAVRGWNPTPGKSNEDRIDMIFAAGPVEVTDVFIMGEEGAEVEKTVTPWPSDHRAFVATFDVDLSALPQPPDLVAVQDPLVVTGGELDVKFFASGTEGERIAIVPEGAGADEATAERSTRAQTSGTLTFDTTGWDTVTHEIQLLDASGAVLASAPIWVLDPGQETSVTTGKATYKVGEAIDVSWYAAPANERDWIGIYHRGDGPGKYLLWEYTKATVAGSAEMGEGTPGGPWPLEPGKYTVRLLIDDSYDSVAESNFVVRG